MPRRPRPPQLRRRTSPRDPVAELYDAFVAGDHERAAQLHYDLHPLVDAAFAETNPVPAKWVMQELGLTALGYAREPLAPLSDAGQSRVRELLARSSHVDLDWEEDENA